MAGGWVEVKKSRRGDPTPSTMVPNNAGVRSTIGNQINFGGKGESGQREEKEPGQDTRGSRGCP